MPVIPPIRAGIASSLLVVTALPAAAQDSAIGTFTVNGKTTRFNHVYATFETSPTNDSEKDLILLVSDVPIAPADRSRDKLIGLAGSGGLHAVKLRWKYGSDSIAVVPYHSAIAESGHAFASMSSVRTSSR